MVKQLCSAKKATVQKGRTQKKDREDLRNSVRARLSQEEVCLLTTFSGT